MKNTIIKPTLILIAVAVTSAFVLSHVEKITLPNIVRQQVEKQEKALSIILPGYRIVKEVKTDVDSMPYHYWIAEKESEGKTVRGYAFISSSPGYSGPVESMVGVDEAGRVLGISILNQTETPGLGARSVELASKNTFLGMIMGTENGDENEVRPWFQDQFSGLDLNGKISIVKRGDWIPAMKNELMEKNAITAITGATITGRAVIRSLEVGYGKLQKALAVEKDAAGGQK